MGRLIYMLNVSLDGYVETPDHGLDWSVVDDETHRWFSDQTRGFAAELNGRRMYELMASYWPTSDADPNATPAEKEFGAAWRATPRIVFSSTLKTVGANSRLVRGGVEDELARIRTEFDGDLAVAGATLAASFIRAGLVDEYRLVVHPVVIGAGTPYWPDLAAPRALRLLETHRFASGVLYLRYAHAR